jgi:hypothetical protein
MCSNSAGFKQLTREVKMAGKVDCFRSLLPKDRRLYVVIDVTDNAMTHENPFDTVEKAKAYVVKDVGEGNCELGDVEIWEMRPILKPRKIETAWDNIS